MAKPQELLQDVMLLSRAAQLVLQHEVVEGLRNADIGPTKLNLLRLLGRQHKQTVNDLARFLGQTKAAASQNVDSLVKAGLVRRESDKIDRRCVWVSLTPKGKKILKRAEERQMAALKRTIGNLHGRNLNRLSQELRSTAIALLESSETKHQSCLQCCAYNSAGCVCEHGDWRCLYALRGESN